jgi:hypothetical protein
MNETQIRFICQNCKQAWSLPPQILAKVVPNRSDLPSAVLTASFLCSLCGALSRCTPEQLPKKKPQNPATSLPSDATVLLCMTFPCNYSDCGLPITIHIVADAQKGTDERKRLTDIALRWKPAQSCALRHPPSSLTQQFGLISVFDELVWEESAL